MTRGLALGAALMALGLLIGFYSVVAGAVHRAESGREMARVALDRQVICSAFSQTSSRDLCLVTVASHAQRSPVMHAVYEPSAAPRRQPTQLAAALY